MSGWFLFTIACIVLVLLPARYDPAIRLKYWLNGWRFPK
jgi:hypothetical protein